MPFPMPSSTAQVEPQPQSQNDTKDNSPPLTNTNDDTNPTTQPAPPSSPQPPAPVEEPTTTPNAPSYVRWTSLGTDPTTLLNGLLDLYWTGIEREIRILILALAEFMQTCPEVLPVEKMPPRPNRLRQNYFADEWTRVDLKGGSDEDEEALKMELRKMYKGFSEHEHARPLIERRAKQLLQAVGWLDIDFIHNDRPPQYPSMTGRPKVETIEHNQVLQAVQCSVCRKCIRTQFFECAEGCKDPQSTKNHYKCIPLTKPASTSTTTPNTSHLIPRMRPKPFRACFSCVITPTISTLHDRSHLTLVNASAHLDSKLPQNIAFSRELDALEDFESCQTGLSTTVMLAMRVTRGRIRRMVPAGNVHMAYRFGTVVIENGVEHTKHGVLITTREPPYLLFNPPPEYLLHPLSSTRKLCISSTSPREIFTKTDPSPPRRVLAVVKQVLSNPFNGEFPHHESCVTMIQKLSRAAEGYMNWNPLQPIRGRIQAFEKAVGEMLEMLKESGMGKDVVIQMQALVETLLNKNMNLRWHPVGNNCQRFCNGLLKRGGVGIGSSYWRTDLDLARMTEQWKGKDISACRVYSHSFAGETRFPLFPPTTASSADEDESTLRLRKSDVGAYLSSMHNTTDLVSFTLGRKLWRRREEMFDGEAWMDSVLGVECGLGCMHLLSDFQKVRELEEEAVKTADHVLGDPFTVMAVLGSQLSRERGLCWNDRGRLWSGATGANGAKERERERRERRWWVENRIKVGVAVDVFLGFVHVVNIFGVLLTTAEEQVPSQSDPIVRIREIATRALGPLPRPLTERKSEVNGRAVMPSMRQNDSTFSSSDKDNQHHQGRKNKKSKKKGVSREALELPGLDMWEMQPTVLPPGCVRTRLRCLVRWKWKGKDMGMTWRRCACAFCGLTDEQLRSARAGAGGS